MLSAFSVVALRAPPSQGGQHGECQHGEGLSKLVANGILDSRCAMRTA